VTTAKSRGSVRPPLKEILKAIPAVFGVSLDEEPRYEVLLSEGGVELRRYQKMLLARTYVAGTRKSAVEEGFRRLAGYIFGENHVTTTLSPTMPGHVSGETNETLSMTSPVFQEQAIDGWTLSFFLPSNQTFKTAPRPNDPSVKLKEVASRLVAVKAYAGNNTEERRAEAARALCAWVERNSYVPESPVFWAQYNAPFIIPFFKKNEAQVVVSQMH